MTSKDRLLDADPAEPGSVARPDGGIPGFLVRLLLLITGDAVMFIIFSFAGRRSHSEAAGLDAIGQVIGTAFPFALAWFAVSPFIGAYRRRLQAQPRAMAQQTALAWLAAWPLAIIVRTMIIQRVPEWTFLPVSLLTNLFFLEAWRVAFSWLNARRGR